METGAAAVWFTALSLTVAKVPGRSGCSRNVTEWTDNQGGIIHVLGLMEPQWAPGSLCRGSGVIPLDGEVPTAPTGRLSCRVSQSQIWG